MGQLLVTAGNKPQRLRSEVAFGMVCGAAPPPASSGRTHRRRLDRGGARQANAALYAVLVAKPGAVSPSHLSRPDRDGQGVSGYRS
jgi:transposase